MRDGADDGFGHCRRHLPGLARYPGQAVRRIRIEHDFDDAGIAESLLKDDWRNAAGRDNSTMLSSASVGWVAVCGIPEQQQVGSCPQEVAGEQGGGCLTSVRA